MEEDGFTLVRPGRTRRTSRNINTKIHIPHNDHETIDVEETIKSIERAKQELEGSRFLADVEASLGESLRGSGELTKIYAYGLGQLRNAHLIFLRRFIHGTPC